MNKQKVILITIFILTGAVATYFSWENSIFLSFLLIILAVIKHKFLPIKKEMIWFIISGITASLVESLIMSSGAWSYSKIDLLNFPLWLMFLWGYAGVLGISLYQEITKYVKSG